MQSQSQVCQSSSPPLRNAMDSEQPLSEHMTQYGRNGTLSKPRFPAQSSQGLFSTCSANQHFSQIVQGCNISLGFWEQSFSSLAESMCLSFMPSVCYGLSGMLSTGPFERPNVLRFPRLRWSSPSELSLPAEPAHPLIWKEGMF